jgi:protein Mpv17
MLVTAQRTSLHLQITALAPRAARSVAAPRLGSSHAAPPPPLAVGGGGGAGGVFGGNGGGGGKKKLTGFWPGGNGNGGSGNNGSNCGNGNGNGGGRGRRITAGAGGGGGGGNGAGALSGLWEGYVRALERSPLLTKAVTSGVISAAGNLLCQVGVERRPLNGLDNRRLALFTALGAAYVAPVLHVWYGLLGRLVTAQGVPGALGRMALDQLAFAPLFVGSMMALLALAGGQSVAAAKQSVVEGLPGAVKANWSLWVPAQFVNFRYVPPNLQVGFSNIVALAWNVYFSFATKPKAAEQALPSKGKGGKKNGGGGKK